MIKFQIEIEDGPEQVTVGVRRCACEGNELENDISELVKEHLDELPKKFQDYMVARRPTGDSKELHEAMEELRGLVSRVLGPEKAAQLERECTKSN